ncbi:MAG: hypothetical protein M3Q06_06835 [Bacteroidota bacterium]|nr:hypothetical protein [Bacteroidota bacterium]
MTSRLLLLLLLLTTFLLHASAQQALPTFLPKEKFTLDFSERRQNQIKRRDLLLTKKPLTRQEQQELNALLEKNDETIESVWDVIGRECSWYCGGGNYAVKASSFLPGTNNSDYGAKSANDLSYQTAWAEGKKDEGIGEYLEYLFENKSPRITQIIISNGYVKSAAAWKNNNRVKKLKLYINGKPYGILQLDDTRSDQVFEVGTLGRNKNGKDLVLRFEIAAVYKGDKYNDTAITEIYFDGIDVH